MATEKILMPQLGESVTEGTIGRWLVSVGDKVDKYDPIAEVTTDKVNSEVPTSFQGTIKELIAEEGETLQVGEVICLIEVEGASEAPTKEQHPPAQQEVATSQTASLNEDQSMKKRYSPAVLRLAQEHNIDLEHVEGTGKSGRITRKDVQKLIAEGGVTPSEATTAPQASQTAPTVANSETQKITSSGSITAAQGDTEIPITGVRRAIANNMLKSKHEAPHAWTMMEVDVTNLVNYRNALKNEFKAKEGFSLTFLPFFIKATVEALREFPRMNSMWAGDKIIEKKDINISIAVATEEALYVPVIKQADELSIKGIGRSVNDLAQKVRSNKLSAEDMQGGTFTVNNTGSFGSILSQPIINYPQAAILSVESIVKRPVIMEGGMIAARDMVNLCLSLDHRILDGLIAGRFLARVKEKLEKMSAETTSIY
ncbi:2-oxoisovalerate dehydrogenase E2 component (dihydrolipoyl transacylase) [Pullulanibacillus pueri]|uniref:Dihydrolipoamide acetyltransferase component of pyruvate dehydrogenase complex n=1 Tax=Pullulanibacillus pueri TaxID=1437324 RepID=A0A8J2ZUX2_9BACL|nr:dihydrolipoamide acetyltransferase family protein [Pullulanibacillus pueri]MBM7681613.1 2-oxoisovalerate dehydrogenase E2 component (dihydrolipoyl transacylase) [Pullulanibacillus pueri]GGH79450.1 lipoamide acyltransferase component of branched-chain alpha-keto acid dehydrogenase complex [Pullulanibacillus pueri]